MDNYAELQENINKERVWLKNRFIEDTGVTGEKRWHTVVPRKVEFDRLLLKTELTEIKNVLKGHATPKFFVPGYEYFFGGEMYADKYKNGVRSRTVLLTGNFQNAVTLSEILEQEFPIKVVFLPHVQCTPPYDRCYGYVKMKVLFKTN